MQQQSKPFSKTISKVKISKQDRARIDKQIKGSKNIKKI